MMIHLQDDLVISSSKLLPSVDFRTTGSLKIEGKLIPDHVTDFFKPLNDWLRKLVCKNIVCDINIEYISNNASVQLLDLLKILNDSEFVETITVNWYYEIEDEEHYEKGMIFSEKLKRIRFTFFSYIL
jgi:hypothetical protein